MQKSARRLMLVLATTGAALAMSMGPASADSDGLSETTQDAWNNWDEGACLVGEGAGQMVSGAWIGAPYSALDLLKGGERLSEPTQDAWKNWDEGAGKLGQGAGQMVSGAWIGVPYSILDFAKDATGAEVALPAGMTIEEWNALTPTQKEELGYTCGE
ncbi:hypothetical protein [Actinopolymorpha alba]|uniref:hypothetical protein n=1 Tax=Actinopolymorpha alba TaxID=533267 RepID=UPI00037CD897|nr:hypothetical protein [Actinopolymorpha alba]